MNRPTNKKTTLNMIDNLYIKPTRDKGVNMPRYPDFKDNYYHQADLLFLPEDNGYKYALVVVDVGSRLIDARPLKTKESDEVLEAFKKIYSGQILKPPTNVISVDSGHEFLSGVKNYFEKELKVQIKKAKPGRHRQQSIVERKNKDIGKLLFKRMTAEEIITKEVNKSWVQYLPKVIEIINENTRKTRKRTIDKKVEHKFICDGDACNIIDQGTQVRAMLDAPVNAYDGKKLYGKFRETDIRFAIKPRTVMQTLIAPGTPPLYLLDDGKGGTDYSVAYTKNQLQIIPSDEKPPDSTQILGQKKRGEAHKWVAEKLIKRFKEKNNKIYFTVKWAGFDQTTNEPRTVLLKDVPDMVKEFEKAEREQAKAAKKQEQQKAKPKSKANRKK